MAVSLLELANREAVAKALTERGYSVTRATVNRWARGSEMPLIAAKLIGELFGHEETAPDVPGRLDEIERKLDEVLSAQQQVANGATSRIIEALAPPARMAQAVELIERLERLLPPPDVTSPEETESAGPAAELPPGRAAE